jgi:hypothetical protein
MSIKGWLFLTASWGIVIGLVIVCFYKIFFKKD